MLCAISYDKSHGDFFPFFGLACPNGWTFHGGSCFLIHDEPTQKWEDARGYCKDLGADLAIVRSADDDDFIFNFIKEQPRVTQYGAWLGFMRLPDGNLYWLDGSPVGGKYMYKAWSRGNPDNSGGHEDCGHMLGTIHDPGKWNDLGCDVSSWARSNAPVILCQKALS